MMLFTSYLTQLLAVYYVVYKIY